MFFFRRNTFSVSKLFLLRVLPSLTLFLSGVAWASGQYPSRRHCGIPLNSGNMANIFNLKPPFTVPSTPFPTLSRKYSQPPALPNDDDSSLLISTINFTSGDRGRWEGKRNYRFPHFIQPFFQPLQFSIKVGCRITYTSFFILNYTFSRHTSCRVFLDANSELFLPLAATERRRLWIFIHKGGEERCGWGTKTSWTNNRC